MATSYRQPSTNASIGKGGATPYNTPFSGVMQPICVRQDRKLLDQFRDKMRSLHYAVTTEARQESRQHVAYCCDNQGVRTDCNQ